MPIKTARIMAKHVENYDRPDPFGYRVSSDDWLRRDIVRSIIAPGSSPIRYKRALDLGAGEGFITEILPALGVWGYDINPVAMSRFPSNVLRFDPTLHSDKFDLICAMGVLYPFYDTTNIIDLMKRFRHDAADFLIAGIPAWEENMDETMADLFGVKRAKTIDIKPYRSYECQRIRLYKPK